MDRQTLKAARPEVSPTGARLLVILSNPPTTSGARTLQRVGLAKDTLGYSSVAIANLFSIPTYRTGGVSAAGADPEGWLAARSGLAQGIAAADAVILAYGIQEPSGPARHHFRDQLLWLQNEIYKGGLKTWMVGGRPRHPSRWHRHTYAEYPDLLFSEALPIALMETNFVS